LIKDVSRQSIRLIFKGQAVQSLLHHHRFVMPKRRQQLTVYPFGLYIMHGQSQEM